MSNTNSLNPTMSELFSDAAREIIERNRIKSQMNRILRIVKADTLRLNNAYAEIGKMYLDGTLDENSARVGVLLKNIEHLKLRIERANIRFEQLREAHSVDECTQAFKAEVTAKVKKAQEISTEFAKDLGEKAKTATDNLSVKAKSKANDTVVLAKNVADELAKKAQEIKEKTVKKPVDSDIADEAEVSDETEEKVDSILDSIADTLQSIDEPIEETEETESDDDTASDSAPEASDGESAESFTF